MDSGLLPEVNVDKKQEFSGNTSVADSVSVLDLTPDDVVDMIGQKLFWKARNTILHQQRTFAMQIFELHRLIKVQRFIAGSPEVLYENIFNLTNPSSKLCTTPTNTLLYVTPLDPMSTVVANRKVEALNPNKICGADAIWDKMPPHVDNDEQGNLANQSTARPSLTPTSTPNAKIAPWFSHQPANQWLVPVNSPPEGLIYKPYTGPCPPTIGIMVPIFGNYRHISPSTVGGAAYGVPAPEHHGIGHFSGTRFGQSYFQPVSMPLINPGSLDLRFEQTIPFGAALSAQSWCNVESQSS